MAKIDSFVKAGEKALVPVTAQAGEKALVPVTAQAGEKALVPVTAPAGEKALVPVTAPAGEKGTIPVHTPGSKRASSTQQQATQSPSQPTPDKTFQESAKEMAENGSTSEKYLANKLMKKRDNFTADLEEARKSGDDKKIAGVFEEYGIEGFDKSKTGADISEMVNNHFANRLKEGPSFGDKMMAHHVPHIAFAGTAVGGSVLALASSKGQKSNEELYGGV